MNMFKSQMMAKLIGTIYTPRKKKLVLEELKHNTLISNLQPPEEERAFT